MEIQGNIGDVRVRLAIVDDKWLVLSDLLSGREISRSMINHPLSIEGSRLKWIDRYIQLDSSQLESAYRLMEVASGKPSAGGPAVSTTLSQTSALSASTGKKPSRKQFIVGISLLLGLVLVVLLITQMGGSSKVTVDYSLQVTTTDSCSNFSDTGYRDIPFAEVEVIDGEGRLLGTANLDGGTDLSSSCVFSATFEVKKSSDGNYRITAGNSNRGYVTWTSDDISDGRLVASASLGD